MLVLFLMRSKSMSEKLVKIWVIRSRSVDHAVMDKWYCSGIVVFKIQWASWKSHAVMISLPHGSVNEANCYCLTHLGGADSFGRCGSDCKSRSAERMSTQHKRDIDDSFVVSRGENDRDSRFHNVWQNVEEGWVSWVLLDAVVFIFHVLSV